ncbi:MAG: hypothetical protein MPJ50_11805 [Pirellulales bacterium]|nr:hypothetical protein [Pirellulales bacterium]
MSSHRSLGEQEEREQNLFEAASRFYGVPITHVRRVVYHSHTGEHLTIRFKWQVREGDLWQDADDHLPD